MGRSICKRIQVPEKSQFCIISIIRRQNMSKIETFQLLSHLSSLSVTRSVWYRILWYGCLVAWLHDCMVAWLPGCMVAWLLFFYSVGPLSRLLVVRCIITVIYWIDIRFIADTTTFWKNLLWEPFGNMRARSILSIYSYIGCPFSTSRRSTSQLRRDLVNLT